MSLVNSQEGVSLATDQAPTTQADSGFFGSFQGLIRDLGGLVGEAGKATDVYQTAFGEKTTEVLSTNSAESFPIRAQVQSAAIDTKTLLIVGGIGLGAIALIIAIK